MRKLCLVFPSPYYLPPAGTYSAVDEESRAGWGTILQHSYQHPYETAKSIDLDSIDVAVPCSEEGVLTAGAINSAAQRPGISLLTARRLSYRAWQREMIQMHAPDLNPKWRYLREADQLEGEIIVKAPASTLGLGCVKLAHVNAMSLQTAAIAAESRASVEIARLRRVLQFEPQCIAEAYISGPQAEISAIVGRDGRVVRWLGAAWQDWGEGRICRYRHYDGPDLHEILTRACEIFSLRSCGVNVEVRDGKIVEVHGRLGEEIGSEYTDIVFDGQNPAQLLLDALGA